MTTNSLNKTLAIDIKPSLQKKWLIVIPHLIGALVLLLTYKHSVYGLWFSIIMFLGIIFSFLYYYRLHGQITLKRSILFLNRTPDKQWHITTRDNAAKMVNLGQNYSGKYLLILNFMDDENRKYTVYITPDSVPSETYRILKVLLTTQKK